MKFLSLFLLAFLSLPLLAQDLPIPGNPYDAVDSAAQRSKAFKRQRWFYEQRMFPYNSIPEDALAKALRQRDALRGSGGKRASLAAPWTNIGPTCGYYFSYGNISSRIATIKYDPNNANTVYLGAAFGGVWKSTNGGVIWTSKTDTEVSLSSGALAIDPANSNIIYYGTGEATYSGASYYGRGLLKSTDGGTTWTGYTTGLGSFTYFSRIVVRPNNSSQILAALGSGSSTPGIARSTNGGASWTIVASGRADDIIFTPSGDTAYATGSGIGYRMSTNGGQTFTTPTSLTMQTRNHIAICKTSPKILYASTYSGSTISVFKSTDGGITFSAAAAGTDFNGGQAWYDFYVHVNPFDPNYVYIGAVDIWRSTNGGTSFSNITNGYAGGNVHVDQHNIDFDPVDANKMFCVNDGGVWYSTDRGTTWTNRNASLTLTQFYRMTSDPSNGAHLMGGTQDNGTQRTTGSLNWAAAFGGDGGEVCFQSQNPSLILGETQNNGVVRSVDGGNNWGSATTGLSGTGAWVGPLISHPDSANIFYTGRQSVFKTTNGGSSWFSISSGISGTIREMTISKSDARVMFATIGSSVYRSTDRGINWSSASTGLPARTITTVSVHPDSSNVVLVTFSGFGAGKVYRSTNTGTTWTDVSGNLPDTPVNDILIFHPGVATSTYLVATDVGVFISSNFGSTWSELADGLPNTVAIHLDYNQLTNKIRIGTHGRGVYETSIPLASLAVTSPNGSETWIAGTSQTIQWSSANLSGNVNVLLSRDGGATYSEVLFANSANDGAEVWTVTGPSTTAARVRIASVDVPLLSDDGNANFTILQPTITALSPDGGEVWSTGTVHQIRWNSANLPGNVQVELSRDGGGSYATILSGLANDGVEPWTVSAPATISGIVRVSSMSIPSLQDASNATFIITPPVAYLARVVLRDAGGERDSLEFGSGAGATDNIDAQFGEYELPPPAPTGVYDLRWRITGTQGSKRDLRDTLGGTSLQRLYSGQFAPGPGGYPVVLRWTPGDLPAGLFTLRDNTSGSVFSINMKVQDSLVVTSEDVSTFQILYDARNSLSASILAGWNMVSVPLTVDDRRKSVLFPTATEPAYAFTTLGYARRDTLDYGVGYWTKFPAAQIVGLSGGMVGLDTINVIAGWNMIGSISNVVTTSNIVQIPPAILVSSYFGYGTMGYTPVTSIEPMKAYWVKVSQNGQFILR
jgi:hypothetical protein